MIQLIFTKLVSHFRQLSRVLSKWQVFLGFFLIVSYFTSDDSETWQEYKMGINLFKSLKKLDDVISSLMV